MKLAWYTATFCLLLVATSWMITSPSVGQSVGLPASVFDAVSKALKVTQATTTAGERNPSSATTSYVVVRQEATLTVISTTAAVTIGGGATGDTHLMGVQILAPLTGTCTIAGFMESGGAAQTVTIPVASNGFKDFFGAINSAAPLVVTCANAADDNLVLVLWRAL